MILKLKKIQALPNQYAQDIKISMVGLYDDSGKFIKFIKLTDYLIDLLGKTDIQIENHHLETLTK